MRIYPLLILVFLLAIGERSTWAQATFTTSGNWDIATNWMSNNIGDNITEDVLIDNSIVAFIPSGLPPYTIGNLDLGNNAGVTVDATSTLNVGELGTPKNVTANNNGTITVAGTMIIWGDLTVNNNLTWNITGTGTVIIKGNVIMNNSASISVSGNLVIDGNFNADNNTNFTITAGGSVAVAGTVTVGNNSNLTGPAGSFSAGGCSQGSGSNWCTGGVLPIKLLYFKATLEGDIVSLAWATEKEDGFDKFEIERAYQNFEFQKIAEVSGSGYSSSTIKEYSLIDETPYIGVNYYRLKAIDLDGSFEYFNIEFITFKGERKVEIYPNPVAGEKLTYKIDFNPTPADQISLTDIHGRQVLSTEVVSFGTNEIDLKNLAPPGLYLLKYTSPAFQQTLKVIVR